MIKETIKNKYPLIIDPEGQAFTYFERNYIKKQDDLNRLEAENIVLQMSQKKSTDIIKYAIENGQTVFI